VRSIDLQSFFFFSFLKKEMTRGPQVLKPPPPPTPQPWTRFFPVFRPAVSSRLPRWEGRASLFPVPSLLISPLASAKCFSCQGPVDARSSPSEQLSCLVFFF